MVIRLSCLVGILVVSYALWAWSALNLYKTHNFVSPPPSPLFLAALPSCPRVLL